MSQRWRYFCRDTVETFCRLGLDDTHEVPAKANLTVYCTRTANLTILFSGASMNLGDVICLLEIHLNLKTSITFN